MSSHTFAGIEAALVVVAVFGLAGWQLVSVRRSLRRDRQDGTGRRDAER